MFILLVVVLVEIFLHQPILVDLVVGVIYEVTIRLQTLVVAVVVVVLIQVVLMGQQVLLSSATKSHRVYRRQIWHTWQE